MRNLDSTKYYSDKQEKLVANYLGWKQVSGSGARPFDKGDVISDDWLAECKTHEKSGSKIYFNASVWKKIQEESMTSHRNSVLITDDGSQTLAKTWCLTHPWYVDTSLFKLSKDKIIIESVNINFADSFLRKYYLDETNTCQVFVWGKKDVIIVPIKLFKAMFVY